MQNKPNFGCTRLGDRRAGLAGTGVRVAREEWPVASEAEEEKRQNKANWQWPLMACFQGVKLDGFGLADAKQTQFGGSAVRRLVGPSTRFVWVGVPE